MEENNAPQQAAAEQPTRTLESDIQLFTENLPYWAQFISQKILSGESIDDEIYDQAYQLLLEDAGLEEKSADREDISISCSANGGDFKENLTLSKVSEVEGINALVAGQAIEFGKNLTIIYGANGSGKSGYIRLLNNVFITKGEKKILSNVHIDHPLDKKAVFSFQGDSNFELEYPKDCDDPAFKQFSVFDEKAVHAHLNNKNQFEFRPAGLMYFAELSEAYKEIEERLNAAIQDHSAIHNLEGLFDGESEIKNIINQLSSKTKVEHFDLYRPFTNEDKASRKTLEEQKAALVALKKDKEIEDLRQQKKFLADLKAGIVKANRFFTAEQLTKAQLGVANAVEKAKLAAQNSIVQFQSEKISAIGSKEWRDFILATDQFAKLQHPQGAPYPTPDDVCLLCHQPLSEEARKLISAYWTFIKSKAEQDSADAKKELENALKAVKDLNLDLLADTTVLYKWLSDKKPDALAAILADLSKLQDAKMALAAQIENRNTSLLMGFQANLELIDELDLDIDQQIKVLEESDVTKEIDALSQKIVLINHKEKLDDHFGKIEKAIVDAQWVSTASKGKTSINKRDVTNKEKELSGIYFNQAYIDHFNAECVALHGNFGISITHSGSSGTSYRQLNLKGKQPTEVLSEGEQKVISLADFLSETILSGINKGMVFDDPVTSLDEGRKAQIAARLVSESDKRQVIVFTHDLVFVSQLIGICKDHGKEHVCHWIEQREGKPGYISLKNSPSYEKEYKTAEKPRNFYHLAKKDDCPAAMREMYIQQGFTALRTCYETLVVFGFFNGVVQRFIERVSLDSMDKVFIDQDLKKEMMESFGLCCRYMEGHSHSDQYAYKKPNLEDLDAEIKRYDEIRMKINTFKKTVA
ncbi:AAA family ATPase [Pedobacter gandavensis]|uniref:AAA family ATPase n=1 Tax=Pedobacter gandavensis TaxID=2679963 RepID=UPI002931D37B|nr:AAA family ATPase [Pedobacter gandavensis]